MALNLPTQAASVAAPRRLTLPTGRPAVMGRANALIHVPADSHAAAVLGALIAGSRPSTLAPGKTNAEASGMNPAEVAAMIHPALTGGPTGIATRLQLPTGSFR